MGGAEREREGEKLKTPVCGEVRADVQTKECGRLCICNDPLL